MKYGEMLTIFVELKSVEADKNNIQSVVTVQASIESPEVVAKVVVHIDCVIQLIVSRSLAFACTVHCPHCLKKSCKDPTLFDFDECISAFMNGEKSISCINSNLRIELKRVVPEVRLHFSKAIDSEDVQQTSFLAEGSFGIVYKGYLRQREEKVEVAVKTLRLEALSELQKFRCFYNEVHVMSKLDCPQLVKLYGITTSPLQMVLEFCPLSDLYAHLYLPELLPEEKFSFALRLRFMLDISVGMQYLHSVVPPIVRKLFQKNNNFHFHFHF